MAADSGITLPSVPLTMIFCTVLLLARGVDWDAAGGPEAFGDSRMFRGGVARVGAGGNVRLLTPVPSKTEAPPSWPLVAEIF